MTDASDREQERQEALASLQEEQRAQAVRAVKIKAIVVGVDAIKDFLRGLAGVYPSDPELAAAVDTANDSLDKLVSWVEDLA